MRRVRSTATVLTLFAAAFAGGCADPASAGPGEPAPTADVERAKLIAATERYRDVENALTDGYIPDPTNMCVTAAMEGQPAQLGGMGIHYFRPDLLGITGTTPRVAGTGTHTDFSRPGVLIYEPQADGALELVAIENLVFQAAWAGQGRSGPPSSFGNEYFAMVDNPATPADEAHGFEPHYELHLWLYRDNPTGDFMPFNPDVTCAHHGERAVAMDAAD